MRVAVRLAAAVSFTGALIAPAILARNMRLSPAAALLVVSAAVLAVWISASTVNWFLSIASVYAGKDGRDTLKAIAAAVELCRARGGAVAAVSTWFGLAHFVAFCIASVTVMVPLALAGTLPGWTILTGVLVITLAYFFVVDFLYVGRLAAYIAIAEWPAAGFDVIQPAILPPLVSGRTNHTLHADTGGPNTLLNCSVMPSESVDQSESIFSDESGPSCGEGFNSI
jgi:hypothetical protein